MNGKNEDRKVVKWKERKEMKWNGMVVPKRVECMCELDDFSVAFRRWTCYKLLCLFWIFVHVWVQKERVQNSDNVNNLVLKSVFDCQPFHRNGFLFGFSFFWFSWLRENSVKVVFCCYRCSDCMGGKKLASFDCDEFFIGKTEK